MVIHFEYRIEVYIIYCYKKKKDSRNVYVGGIPVVLAAVMQTPLKLGILQLDGIGVATFLSIILHQLLRGHKFLKHCMRRD